MILRRTFLLGLPASLAAATLEQVGGGGTAAIGPIRGVRLNEPFTVAFDRHGNWYVCEYKGQRVVRVDPSGRVTVVAGVGTPGFSGDDGPAPAATLRDPHGIAVSRDGVLYIADTLNHRVRRVRLATGVIDTLAGTGTPGFSGDGGPAARAAFHGTFAVALDPSHRGLFVTDLMNRRIRRIDLSSGVVTTVAGNGEAGIPADGSPAASSPLVDPRAAAMDSQGNLYVLERKGNALRVVNRAGGIRTLLGPESVTPSLNGPKHLCIDPRDRVVIADADNHLIRRYDPRDRSLTTLAGTGKPGGQLTPADPLQTGLDRPHGVEVSPAGDLYIADSYNHRVLRLRG